MQRTELTGVAASAHVVHDREAVVAVGRIVEDVQDGLHRPERMRMDCLPLPHATNHTQQIAINVGFVTFVMVLSWLCHGAVMAL